MKVAFITYEYPPDTADGGIATSVQQEARALLAAGHHVEVIAASREREGTGDDGGLTVHRTRTPLRADFSPAAGPVFLQRHAEVAFDVLVGPDYNADARGALQLAPAVPLVLQLHSPTYRLLDATWVAVGVMRRWRLQLSSWRRGTRPPWHYDPVNDIERLHALDADEVVSPSRALAEETIADWSLDASRVVVLPYIYAPSDVLLAVDPETRTSRVTYVGRVEVKKGVIDFVDAIRIVRRRFPQARFRLVGRPTGSPNPRLDMDEYLLRRLGPHRPGVEVSGPVPLDEIPRYLADTDVCVFPSVWDNFPNTCLEAMAAARGVVGSTAGGMADMIEPGHNGLLVPPFRPRRIAEAICTYLGDPDRRIHMGRAARERILSAYSTERIVPLLEASFARAIERRLSLGPRPTT